MWGAVLEKLSNIFDGNTYLIFLSGVFAAIYWLSNKLLADQNEVYEIYVWLDDFSFKDTYRRILGWTNLRAKRLFGREIFGLQSFSRVLSISLFLVISITIYAALDYPNPSQIPNQKRNTIIIIFACLAIYIYLISKNKPASKSKKTLVGEVKSLNILSIVTSCALAITIIICALVVSIWLLVASLNVTGDVKALTIINEISVVFPWQADKSWEIALHSDYIFYPLIAVCSFLLCRFLWAYSSRITFTVIIVFFLGFMVLVSVENLERSDFEVGAQSSYNYSIKYILEADSRSASEVTISRDFLPDSISESVQENPPFVCRWKKLELGGSRLTSGNEYVQNKIEGHCTEEDTQVINNLIRGVEPVDMVSSSLPPHETELPSLSDICFQASYVLMIFLVIPSISLFSSIAVTRFLLDHLEKNIDRRSALAMHVVLDVLFAIAIYFVTFFTFAWSTNAANIIGDWASTVEQNKLGGFTPGSMPAALTIGLLIPILPSSVYMLLALAPFLHDRLPIRKIILSNMEVELSTRRRWKSAFYISLFITMCIAIVGYAMLLSFPVLHNLCQGIWYYFLNIPFFSK